MQLRGFFDAYHYWRYIRCVEAQLRVGALVERSDYDAVQTYRRGRPGKPPL